MGVGPGPGQRRAAGLCRSRPLPGPPHRRAKSGTARDRDAGSRDPGTESPGAGIPEMGTPAAGMAEKGWKWGSKKPGCWGRGCQERECQRRRSQEQDPRSGEGSGVLGPRRSPYRGGRAAAESFGVASPGRRCFAGPGRWTGSPGAGRLGHWWGVSPAVPRGLRYRTARISFDFFRFRLISFYPSGRGGAGRAGPWRAHPRAGQRGGA